MSFTRPGLGRRTAIFISLQSKTHLKTPLPALCCFLKKTPLSSELRVLMWTCDKEIGDREIGVEDIDDREIGDNKNGNKDIK